MSDDCRAEFAFLGMESAPSFVRQPSGAVECFAADLKISVRVYEQRINLSISELSSTTKIRFCTMPLRSIRLKGAHHTSLWRQTSALREAASAENLNSAHNASL
jgi:hypothetical protein